MAGKEKNNARRWGNTLESMLEKRLTRPTTITYGEMYDLYKAGLSRVL